MSVFPLDGMSEAANSDVVPSTRSATVAVAESRDWPTGYAHRLALTDAIGVVVAAALVHATSFVPWDSWGIKSPVSPGSIALTAVIALAWLVALSISDSRDGRVIGWGADEYKRVVRATLPLFAVLAMASYLFRLGIPRTYVVVMLPIGLLIALAGRFGWRRWLHRRRAAGDYMTRVLAVGDARTVNDLVRDLSRASMSGYQVVGACVPSEDTTDGVLVPVIGGVEEVVEVARRAGVDAVAVTASGAFGAEEVRKLSWELEDTGTGLVLAPALTNIAGPRVHTQPVGGLPLIHVEGPTYRGANKQLKRIFDLVGATLLLVLLSPVLVAVAIAVKLDGGPVFFRQERAGLHGQSFRMVKFRSMVVNAEKLLAQVAQDRDAGNAVMFKSKNDPRITRVGRFIRRFSLDELPQLFNVVTGEMSLVGPRPPLMSEVALYGTDARRRMLVKPGITGLWQVSGRSDLTWDDTVRLDAYYVENWSITGDLVILWKTAKAVVSSSGAY